MIFLVIGSSIVHCKILYGSWKSVGIEDMARLLNYMYLLGGIHFLSKDRASS